MLLLTMSQRSRGEGEPVARTRNQQILAPKTATDLFQYIPTGLDEALPTPRRRARWILSCAFFGLMILTQRNDFVKRRLEQYIT